MTEGKTMFTWINSKLTEIATLKAQADYQEDRIKAHNVIIAEKAALIKSMSDDYKAASTIERYQKELKVYATNNADLTKELNMYKAFVGKIIPSQGL